MQRGSFFFLVIAFASCGGEIASIDADGGSTSSIGTDASAKGDTSNDACRGPAPACSACDDTTTTSATCVDGAWTCPELPCPPPLECDDASAPDCLCGAMCLPDGTWRCSGCPAMFACGNETCLGGELCTDTPPGIVDMDGGFSDTYACPSIPTACQGNPTCDCIENHPPAGCTFVSCTRNDTGWITVVCQGI